MTNNELVLLNECFNNCSHYLEFGSGKSTEIAVKNQHIQSIHSVESSKRFVEQKLLPIKEIQIAVESKKLHFHCVDIGQTGQYGYPVDHATKESWPVYSDIVRDLSPDWDLILIDGRFRVACLLNVLLHINSNCKILFHDFWNRNEYHEVLNFLDVIKSVDSFGLFTKRNIYDEALVKSLYESYKYIPT